MTYRRTTNWALALLIIGIYAVMATLDGPSDHQAQADQIRNLQAIRKQEDSARLLAASAAVMCGDNAAWQLVDATTVQCTTKRGYKTKRVTL